ncbi:hypothetical protein ACJIZ3_018582 [Penstemon smallii]|uniref:Bifunctional inhibitor/plant lipid transfer protein/seed storage helical domain-containing protein n=1 Tax=Penstemon smallii TaxID=265156 RepID=A0ABD3SZM8_9LAMI
MSLKNEIAFGKEVLPSHPNYCDILQFIKHCSVYIQRFSPRFRKPNEKCCVYARKADLIYFCKYFVTEKEQIYSSAKVVDSATHCGKPFPKNSKCGNYTVHS